MAYARGVRRRKRGTNQWYVYTFIADRPLKAVKAKIRAMTHRVSQANLSITGGQAGCVRARRER